MSTPPEGRSFSGQNSTGQHAIGIVKRSVVIAGHRTSVSLEEAFWQLLRRMAEAEGIAIAALVARIDSERRGGNLSSAIRLSVLDWVMTRGDIGLRG